MHRDGGVAEQGFGAGGGNDQHRRCRLAGGIGDRVADVPERALFLLAHHLQIGDGGVQHRIPVHQSLAAIDQPLFVQAHEHLGHRRRQPRVHGEALARPIGRGAHAAQLPRDGVARLGFPLPDPLQKSLTAEVVARQALGGELTFDHHLRRDAGVVGARLPQCRRAAHAVVTRQHVHQRVLEGVAHVQRAGDVGRRDHDAVGRFAALCRIGAEMAARLPAGVPLLLQLCRLIAFVQSRGHGGSLGSIGNGFRHGTARIGRSVDRAV